MLDACTRRNSEAECHLCRVVAGGTPEAAVHGFTLACTQTLHLRRGDHLFRAGAPCHAFYVVHSGCFKVYAVDRAGREYIRGFRFPGEMIGMHGLTSGAHQFNAMALADSKACKISHERFTAVATHNPELYTGLLRMTAEEQHSNLYLSGNFTAEERVAGFLFSHAAKLRRSANESDLHLPMSRGDIAIHLRLTLATVSRIVSRMKQDGILESDYHHIRILDDDRLRQLCDNVPFIAD